MRGWCTVAVAVMGPNSPLEAPSCILLEMALLYGFCSGSVKSLGHQEGHMDPPLGVCFGARQHLSSHGKEMRTIHSAMIKPNSCDEVGVCECL